MSARPQPRLDRAPPHSRLGPRPLPLHLMGAMTSWLGSVAALPSLKSGWPRSKPALANAARDLAAQLAAIAPEAFSTALERELRSQADAFLRGLERYRHHPYRRAVAAVPTVWQDGTTRLLDYGPSDGVPVLVVPSLINRYYVLDLRADHSFLRHLSAQGVRPLVVDWDAPGELERGFTLTDYIAGRLDAAFEAAAELAGAPLVVVGYCMGGLLALALALRRQRDVAGLMLLATPWDFHAEQTAQARLLGSLGDLLAANCTMLGEVPVDVLQSLFASSDPLLAVRKFSRFAALAPESAEAAAFVALEDWLNDGVPLALPVARESLGEWYGANVTGRGEWRVAGSLVEPERFNRPALVVVPAHDRLVLPGSAAALARLLPDAASLTPPLGHIGMIAGGRTRAVWQGLADWLRHYGAAPSWTRGAHRL
jgi:polyhydroxyalkanoate synthase